MNQTTLRMRRPVPVRPRPSSRRCESARRPLARLACSRACLRERNQNLVTSVHENTDFDANDSTGNAHNPDVAGRL